jgi:hypothetical protein
MSLPEMQPQYHPPEHFGKLAQDNPASGPRIWEKEHRVELMEPTFRRLGNRLRRMLAFIRTSFAKPGGDLDAGPSFGKDLKSQRMCPFCGLITSSYKTCCLECGKSLKPA